MKRFNPFSIDETIIKYNVTFEEATKIVNQVKLQRSTNIQGFIFRYGEEEGIKKYNEYCNKSKHTKESFKNKYGDNWQQKWNDYILSKNSRSLSKLIERYGEENGTQKFYEIQKQYKYSMSLAAYIDKYGEDVGKKEYDRLIQSMDSSTLDFHIKKYGHTQGKEEYIKRCLQKDSSSKEFFYKKYGSIEGDKKFIEKSMKCSPIFTQLVQIYGIEDATRKYKDYLQNKENSDTINNIRNKIYEKFKSCNKVKSSCSSQANKLFSLIEENLGHKLLYGSRKYEIKLFDENNNKIYYYDCYDANSNTIIEFNGSLFHANTKLDEDKQNTWTTAYGISFRDSLKYDNEKINYALSQNFKVIIVWDYEVNTKNKLYNKINEIIRIIKNEG